MKISVVIPNFNGISLLMKNLPIVTSIFNKYEIILVDDASTDDSCDFVRINFPKVILVERSKNKGFASTVNDGVTVASGDLVFLLNSDAVPKNDFFDTLIPYFNDPLVFAVGCLQEGDLWKNVDKQGRGIGKFDSGFLMHNPGETKINNTLWVFGGAGLFRKSIWDKLGGLNNLYDPFYWEDIDLSYRAQKAGYKIFFESRSIVIHKRHVSTIKSNYSDEYVKKISYRNQIMFVWLNITDYDYLLKHLFYLPYHLLIALIHRDLTFIAGFFTALKNFPQILKFRMNNNKFRQISDKEILENLNT